LTTQGKRTALTRLRGLGAALGLALLVTFGVATPASASAPVLLSGASWLGGNGVNVCSNANGGGSDPDCGGQTQVGNVTGAYWQCVELAQRLYKARGWHTGIFSGVPTGAYQIYDSAAANGFTRQANGSITSIVPGDMIIHGTDAPYSGGAGHVSIVDTVVGTAVNVVEQNSLLGMTRATYSFSNSTLMRANTGTIRGVVHAPGNTATGGNPGPAWGGVGNTATFQGSDHLSSSQILHSNEYLMSNNGQTVLMMQTDGNVVLYRGRSAIWSTGTGNNNGAYLTVQNDGNIVVYSASNAPLWWTGTTSVTTLTVQTDGNLVGYPTTGPAEWQAGTGGEQPLTYLGTNHLSAGDQIHPNQYIRSADGRYFLMAQTDGNIVLYGPGYHVLWTTATGGHPGGAYITVQTDGNIVVYSATSAALWWTGTTNTAILWLQNDGNLVGRNSADAPTWSSGTGGQI
jgi:hypothetical protein